MKNVLTKLRTTALLCCFFCAAFAANAQYVNIPDADFRNALQQLYPSCFNVQGMMDTTCTTIVQEDSLTLGNANFTSIDGVQYFDSLKVLICNRTAITSLPVLHNGLLKLYCYNSPYLTSLPPLPSTLKGLYCSYSPIRTLPATLPPNLRSLVCDSTLINHLPPLPSSLLYLSCTKNYITTFPALPNGLLYLNCGINPIASFPPLPASLTYFYCYQDSLTVLPPLPSALQYLIVQSNQLTNIDLYNLTNLKYLDCIDNRLTNLNLQGLHNLETLKCAGNFLPSLDLQGLNLLKEVDCRYNQITSLDVDSLAMLQTLYLDSNPLTCLSFLPNNLSNLTIYNTNIGCIANRPISLINGNGAFAPLCAPSNSRGCLSSIDGRIFGNVLKSLGCVASTVKLSGLLVTATNIATNEIYINNSDTSGLYEIGVPTGTYTISVAAPNSYWSVCSNTATITITQSGQQVTRNVLVNALVPCTDMEIDHAAQTIMRPCSTATMVVNYYNKGTIASQGSYAELTLAPELTLSSASVAYTAQGNNVYRFAVGSVSALQRGSFTLNVAVACTAVINQTLCTHAEIFPHGYCSTGTALSWDGSDVTVTGRCVGNNQVRFVLTNAGTLPMTVAQSYWIVEDNIMVRGGTFQLAASGSDSVTITADPHKIYRIIAAETAGNPAHNTQETFLVWGCDGATNAIHWGFVNQYALNSGSAFEHQLCTQVRTSFDPNDISAVPEGTQSAHFIPKDTEIEYTIRFQNTGNDTAFVVRLLNALPDPLDKTTLKIGASSHPMTYSLKGNGVLEFLYINILLPDSTTNEAKSHGFVRYKIRTKSNVVAGQTIDNQANIYFDVNAPVATNTYRHTIAADVASVFLSLSEVVTNRNYTVKVVPNPMHDSALLEIIANEDINNKVKTFTLYNVFGQAITTQTFNDNTLLLHRKNMPSGCYIYTINIDNEQISKGKIVVE